MIHKKTRTDRQVKSMTFHSLSYFAKGVQIYKNYRWTSLTMDLKRENGQGLGEFSHGNSELHQNSWLSWPMIIQTPFLQTSALLLLYAA